MPVRAPSRPLPALLCFLLLLLMLAMLLWHRALLRWLHAWQGCCPQRREYPRLYCAAALTMP